MSAHVSFNLFKQVGQRDKMRGLLSVYIFTVSICT